MVNVNGVEMPMQEMSGLIVLEDQRGNQSWSLIVDATVEYGDAEFHGDEMPEMKVIVTMKPGERLRMASNAQAGEENVLVYSRLLVHTLREERDRYADLQKTTRALRENWNRDAIQLENERRDRDEMLYAAWGDGARRAWWSRELRGKTLKEVLEMNPHPEPEDDTETDGCHVCGGPDH